MLMILARLVRSESFWAIVKVRSPHTGPEPGYPRIMRLAPARDPAPSQIGGLSALSRAKTPYLPTYCGRQPPGSVPHLPTYCGAAQRSVKRKILV